MRKQLSKDLFLSKTKDFLDVFLSAEAGNSQHTIRGYRNGLTAFRYYITDERHLSIKCFKFSDCTFDFLLEYRNWLCDVKKYKPRTVNNRMAALRSYLDYAAAKDVRLQQITLVAKEVPFLREPREMLPVLTDDQIAEMLAMPKNTPLGRRDYALMNLLYDTAIRAEELTKINLRDVHLENSEPYISIQGKGSKKRDVSIIEETVDILKDYVEEFHQDKDYDSPLFFTTIHGMHHRMSTANLERIIRKYGAMLREKDRTAPEHIYPHMIRRTRATGMYQDGVDINLIATILGHAHVETTKAHYAHPSLKQKREAMEKGKPKTVKKQEQEWPDDEAEFAKACGLK